MDEAERIRAEYARRAETLPRDLYALHRPANLFADQQRVRALLGLLHRERLFPLEGKRILDVGCGEGDQLVRFESWGARAEDLAGIDLIESRIAKVRRRFAGALAAGPDLQLGDASTLPWPDASFDIAYQGTMFTSIKDPGMKRAIATEILRVLRPGGVLIWYDFLFDNPSNRHVAGIRAHEIRALFPGCDVQLKRTTLAPPISRRLVPFTWTGSLLLEKLVFFNTHYLGTIRKTGASV